MIDLDELIAPARVARVSFEVPRMARPAVIGFLPMHIDNPAFLDAVLREELTAESEAKGIEMLRQDAERVIRWCSLTLTIDGEDRTDDAPAFVRKLVELAPTSYTALSRAVMAASRALNVDTQALEGNSSPA